MASTTPRIKPASAALEADVPAGEPIATFSHSPRRTIPFMFMLVALMAVGAAWVAQAGLREGWVTGFLFIVLPGFALVVIAREILRGGPVLIIAEEGFIDRRRGEELITWDRIGQATARNLLFIKGVRIFLTDGERYDIDLGLLNAEPRDIIRFIHAAAERQRESEND